jgi:hypothetical protein
MSNLKPNTFPAHIAKTAIQDLPLTYFEGEVVMVDRPEQVAEAAAYLNQFTVLGVDTEARPSFKRGVHYPTALVQISTQERCYLFRLTHVGLPVEIAQILANPAICKVGLAFKDDINGLRRRREFKPANCIDLQSIVCKYGIMDMGLQKIFAIICCLFGAALITNLVGARDLRFDLLGMGAAVMNGVGIAMQVCVPRYFEKQFRKDTMLTYGFLGAAGFMALFVDHGKIIGSFTGPGGMKVLLSALALSVFCTLVANTIFVKSASYVEPATTTILSALEVVVGAIVGLLLFREVLTAIQIVGAVIIVVASLGMELAEKPGSGNSVEKE